MKRVLISTALIYAGGFVGALGAGLLVRLSEVFMRSQADALAYSLTMTLGVFAGVAAGLAVAEEGRR